MNNNKNQTINGLPIHQSLYVNGMNSNTDNNNNYNIRVSNVSPRVHNLTSDQINPQYRQLKSPSQINYYNKNNNITNLSTKPIITYNNNNNNNNNIIINRSTIKPYPQKVNISYANNNNYITNQSIIPPNNTTIVKSYAQRPHYQHKYYPQNQNHNHKHQQHKNKCSYIPLLLLGILALFLLIAALILAFTTFSNNHIPNPQIIPATQTINQQYPTTGNTVLVQSSNILQKNNTIQTNGTIPIINQEQQKQTQGNGGPNTSPGILPPGPDTQPGLSPLTSYRFPQGNPVVKPLPKPTVVQSKIQTSYQSPQSMNTDFQYAPNHPLYGTYYGTSLKNIRQTLPFVSHYKEKKIHRLNN